MTLKTLGKTTWEEIEVGEVFAWRSCFVILVKMSGYEARCVCTNHAISQNNCEWEDFMSFSGFGDLYKLPLSTQRLWRQDT